MASLEETEVYESGIYQLEITDPVIAGPGGISNLPTKQLANRTKWLKAKIDSVLASTFEAAKALKLSVARKISLSGIVSGSANFDGSSDINISLSISDGALSIAKTNGLQSALDGKLSSVPDATSSSKGIIQLATAQEVQGLSEPTKAVTPAGLGATKPIAMTNFLHIQDQKATGVSGGTPTAGAWNTRVLNTILVNNIPGASLLNNIITLPAGEYYIEATAPAVGDTSTAQNQRNKVAIKTTTNGLLLLGTSECIQPSGSSIILQTRSCVSGKIVLSSPTQIIVDHYFTSSTSYALGVATNISGYAEVYTDIKIWKVA